MSASNPDPNGMGMSIGPQAVVLICIFGAAALVMVGYASTHYYFSRESDETTMHAGSEFDQVRYMRDVRVRYKEDIANSHGTGRRWREINEAKRMAQARSSGGVESGFS